MKTLLFLLVLLTACSPKVTRPIKKPTPKNMVTQKDRMFISLYTIGIIAIITSLND